MMKRLWRWARRAALIGVVLCVALLLAKDTVLKSLFQSRLRKEIGLEVQIERLHAGLLTPTMDIQNLKVLNAAEFGGAPLLDIPEINLEYVASEALSGKVHLKRLRLDLARVNLVKNKAGKMNIEWAEDSPSASAAAPANPKTGFEFGGIDQMNITLGKIVYSDERDPANSQEFDLGIKNEVVSNLKSESDLTDWLMTCLVNKGVNRIGEASVSGGKPARIKRSRRVKKAAPNVSVPQTAGATNN